MHPRRPKRGLYPALVRAHRRLHTHGPLPRAPFPVFTLALGGLRSGGSGKTPLTHTLARAAAAHDLTVAVITAGYSLDRARASSAPGRVVDTQHIPASLPTSEALARCAARFGDEAAEAQLRFALDPPDRGRILWLTARRRRDAFTLAQRALAPRSPDLVLLDDALHHHRLAPHRAVAVVTPGDASARALPFGPLRDDLTLLERADCVVFYRPSPQTKLTREDRALARSAHAQAAWRVGPLHTPSGPIDPGRFGAAALITATGAPQRVREAAEGAGLIIVRHIALRDHAVFTPRLTRRLHATCRRLGLRAVVTLKDYVKLSAPWSRLRPRIPLVWLDGHAHVSDGLTRILEGALTP